jgi:hypothetical protein
VCAGGIYHPVILAPMMRWTFLFLDDRAKAGTATFVPDKPAAPA